MMRRVILLIALTTVTAFPALAQLSAQIGLDGNTINYTAGGGSSSDTTLCVTNVLLDGQQLGGGNGTAPPCTRYPQSISAFYCNSAGTHVISAYAGNPQGKRVALGPDVTVTVTSPPPAGCNMVDGLIEFGITDYTPEADRRVLQSNLHTGYPYPHYQALLAQDAVIPMSLRTVLDGVQTSGASVTLSFIDPPDRSPYIVGPPGGATPPQPVPGPRANDNAGPLPKLSGTGITDNGNGTYSATSGQNGFVEWHLELDPAARAGDNYQILAHATFPDGRIAGGASGAVTVWKRLFVEKMQMFRRGAPLASDAPVGLKTIIIPDGKIASTGITAFAKNDYVMLLHAPTWGTTKGASYRGVYQIALNPARFRATAPTNGTGTVTTSGSTAIVGTGTRFTQLIVGDVITIGPDVRVIIAITDNTHLTVDSTTTVSATNQPYRIGDPKLTVGQYYKRLTLNRALTERYGIESLADQGVLTLNDAVVRLAAGSMTASDYFDADHTALTMPPLGSQFANPFSGAYTEYIVLPPQPTPTPVPRMVLTGAKVTQQFIDKWFDLPAPRAVPSTSLDHTDWFLYDTPPNHQLLLIGDADDPDVTLSQSNGFLSKAITGERASVVNRGTVDWAVTTGTTAMYQANADTILRRTTVHEITHQWWVNDPFFGNQDHCHPEVAYDSAASYPSAGTLPSGLRFCLMSSAAASPYMPAPWNTSMQIKMVEYQYRSGFTTYHIAQLPGGWNSEYLSIRRTLDPWRP
jgi:hypothetical protein